MRLNPLKEFGYGYGDDEGDEDDADDEGDEDDDFDSE